MSRWIVVALALASCNPPLSDRQFCTKQQMAWETAFPAAPQTDEQRKRMVDYCLSNIAAKHRSGRYDREVACFDKSISGRGHATEEYLAYEKCAAAGSASSGASE
jgi:hypothetical protein